MNTSRQEGAARQSAQNLRTYPQGSAQLLPGEGAYVTGFTFVLPVLPDEGQSPLPLEGRSPAEGFCAGLLFEHSLHTKRTP